MKRHKFYFIRIFLHTLHGIYIFEFGVREKKQNVIGKIVSTNPSEGERYFLRVLLNHVKGPKSFQDLRTVNNIVVLTYRETAFLHDLIGGSGKTFLYKALLAAVRSRQLIALATASSGVVASSLPAGRTGHSRFKISLQASSDMRCSVSKQSSLDQLLQMTKLIMWDEAPMINRCAFEVLDKMLKDIIECELLFGVKVVVFGGDFRQVLPVVQRGTKDDIMKAKREHTYHMIKLPSDIIIDFESKFESLKKLIAIVFPNFHTYGDNLNTMMNRVILTSKNEHVDVINNMLVKEIPEEIFTNFSFDEVIDKTE
ncbi:uncharacterized protein LOC111406425 [Olea europaea var. sylvestris]|uniref:uncharacterized protein LOC111406425 n=1 Tax=Olea europaea var. sylvestris TaxID=158386 RepID=UPI000C1D4265|nr:uncharacterized protein LOC111406425 [Olea europaea var. sylvestris]